MKTNLCDSCNSTLVVVKKGKKIVVECSYCGKPHDKGVSLDYFIKEYDGEKE